MKAYIAEAILSEKYAGLRLDKAMVELFPDFSRSVLQESIKSGYILIDGQVWRPRDLVSGGEKVVFDAGKVLVAQETEMIAEDLVLDIVYEDDDLILVNKEAGMVVHPAAGHPRHTLVNALLHRRPDLRHLPRAGLIHRLDKDTSGLLLVAGNHAAYNRLIKQMQNREIRREYITIVSGEVIGGGTVDAPVGRHPRDRKRMAVTPNGKPAVTHYQVEQRFEHATLLRVRLETGRTHQIRVHLAHIRCPILCDPVYGSRSGRHKLPSPELRSAIANFGRQALHATRLELHHPTRNERQTWESHLPDDMRDLIALFDADR